MDKENKPRIELVPPRIITAIAAVREFGIIKHNGSETWRALEPPVFRDKANRHWTDYCVAAQIHHLGVIFSNGIDKESGLPSLWHLACNIAFLIEKGDGEWGLKK